MKKTNFLMMALTSVLILSTTILWGQVTLPHLDAIDYTAGQPLQTQTGWTSLNSGDDLLIASGSLSYAGLAASTGNKVTFDGVGIDAAKLFTQQTSGTVYYSFLLNVTALGSLNTAGGYFSGFTEGTGTNFGATVWTRQDGTGYDIGISHRSNTAVEWSTGTTPINTTVLIVISYQFVSGTGNDVVKLWINPTPGAAEPAATLTVTTFGGDLANVNRILIRQDGALTTPFIQMDELRIGTTWASVTPAAPVLTLINSGSGYVEYSPGGLKGVPTCSVALCTATFAYNASVQIFAIASPGWTFTSFSGDTEGGTKLPPNPINVVMNQNRTITATFTLSSATPTLTVSPASLTGFNYAYGAGPSAAQSFTVSGTNLVGTVTLTAPTNYEISLTSGSGYTSPITLTPVGGTVSTTVFVRLKAGLAVGFYNSEVINVTSTGATTKTVTCYGRVNPVFTLHVVGGGEVQYTTECIKVSPPQCRPGTCTAVITYGCDVRLVADSDPGWTFAGYTGDIDTKFPGTADTELVVLMNQNRTITATFTEDDPAPTLTVIKTPPAGGNVTVHPGGPYTQGQCVQLTATPNPGYTFVNWTGEFTECEKSPSTSNPISISLNGNTTITANFVRSPSAIPLSNWAIYAGIALMLGFLIIRFRRLI